MCSARFPREARLLHPRDFARLRETSRRVSSTNFGVQVGANDASGARLGLAVSRRVSKRAVRRNRIKRIVRDSFRRHRQLLPACDILLIARAGADFADNASLHSELELLWQRIVALNATRRVGTMRA
ncbi:ribonuclease P protein component [Dokdonella sp.]|uniref:ribonuclease P protein component n=1 Tax=Dokdonella sp. TaxID=2291710 RepID=UPI0031CBC2FF|nr:ribonuclease P protein component [Dokdonella sp.]